MTAWEWWGGWPQAAEQGTAPSEAQSDRQTCFPLLQDLSHEDGAQRLPCYSLAHPSECCCKRKAWGHCSGWRSASGSREHQGKRRERQFRAGVTRITSDAWKSQELRNRRSGNNSSSYTVLQRSQLPEKRRSWRRMGPEETPPHQQQQVDSLV